MTPDLAEHRRTRRDVTKHDITQPHSPNEDFHDQQPTTLSLTPQEHDRTPTSLNPTRLDIDRTALDFT